MIKMKLKDVPQKMYNAYIPCSEWTSLCWWFVSECPQHVCVGSASQERDPRQRLGGERPEGNLSVVSSERASQLGGRQQPLDLQLILSVSRAQDGSHHTLHLFGFSSSEPDGRRCVIAFLLLFFHRMYFFIWGEMIFFTPQTCTKWRIVSAFIVVSVKSRTLAHVYSF